MRIQEGQAIPVIARADVLVVGSSLNGCFAASRLAEKGLRPVLASPDMSLPFEIAICNRPWVDARALEKAPEDVSSLLVSCAKGKGEAATELNVLELSSRLEDHLLGAGARLYYDLHPCGVQTTERRITAVIFGCKGGWVAIEARAVVDCTPDARVAALAGAELKTRESTRDGVLVRYSMLCKTLPEALPSNIAGVDVVGDRLAVHGRFAEFHMRMPLYAGPFRESAYNLEARRRAAAVGAELNRDHATETKFARGGDRVLIDPVTRIVSRSRKGQLTHEACRPKAVDNLMVFSACADVTDSTAATAVTALGGTAFLEVLDAAPWKELSEARHPNPASARLRFCNDEGPKAALAKPEAARFMALAPVYRTSETVAVPPMDLPVMAQCEVLVVGAGTSGMPAALTAARQGARVIALEKYGDVGGTHTIGGVSRFWFGRDTAFLRRLNGSALREMQRTGMPKCAGMLGLLRDAGVELLTHCFAVGTVVEGVTVTGVVVVTPDGLGVVRGKRIIDATGDADIVARAGATTTYGASRDATTMWYSFGQYVGTAPEAARHFAFIVDLRDPTDMTRAAVASRRYRKRSKADFPQFYLTPRESRNIRGGYRVTYEDIAAQRLYEDTVLVCRADFDIKGIADSDHVLCGYVSQWKEVHYARIPFRALCPTELENILVVGKAICIDHDGLALARMQKDMMAMGGVAGCAGARALRRDVSFSRLDVKALQRDLVALGVLTGKDLLAAEGVRDNALPKISEAELERAVEGLAAGTLDLAGKVRILARPERALPLLSKALTNAHARPGKVAVAQALCFLGKTRGADLLLAEVARALETDGLSMKSVVKMHHSTPDHGSAPALTYLINALGRARDPRVIPFLTEIARRVNIHPHKADAMFNYVFSVCYAAERLGAPDCVEALGILSEKPGIKGGLLPNGTDPRRSGRGKLSLVEDRFAYLELCIGRALARCGSVRGYEILFGYLSDIRGFLARSAHEELVRLTKQDLGYDESAWRACIGATTVAPQPFRIGSAPRKR